MIVNLVDDLQILFDKTFIGRKIMPRGKKVQTIKSVGFCNGGSAECMCVTFEFESGDKSDDIFFSVTHDIELID